MGDQNSQQTQQQTQQQTGQASQQTQQQTNQQTSQQAAKRVWDEVLKGLDPEDQKLYAEDVAGLKATVQSTRDERDGFEKQLKALLPKVEKGSETEKALQEALGGLEKTNKRANFLEQAIKPEIGCQNPKAAYAVALQYDLFKKNGDPDWEAIKKETPESFGSQIPESNGGSGTKSTETPVDFNTLIRQATGYNKN